MKKLLFCFLTLLLSIPASAEVTIAARVDDPVIVVSSPDGLVQANVYVNITGRLVYTLTRNGTTVLEPSPLGITLDNVDLGQGVTIGTTNTTTINETYPWRGLKSVATNHAMATAIGITHTASGKAWTLETRAYDDGFAFRYVVPGSGSRRFVNNEATAWAIPNGAKVWYQTDTEAYEGNYQESSIIDLNETAIGMPVTIELFDGSYAAIMESNVIGYSGMKLKSNGDRKLQGIFSEGNSGWGMTGDIRSAWRVTMTGEDLNTLVNSDIVHNLAPPADPSLFPNGMATDWIKPGRTLWSWWAYNNDGMEWSLQKDFVDDAAALNFQYYLVDAGWEMERYGWLDENGQPWEKLKELADYAATKGIGIWVWRDWEELYSAEQRSEFFANVQEAGVKGVKIDYMNSESHGMLDFYQKTAIIAAEHQIMINWHGATKPAGEARFWPHEMTREGIRGLEHNKYSGVTVSHYAALPFTRYLAGHGDFTPTTLDGSDRYRKGTTHALQLASAMVFNSPQLVWADKSDRYLNSSAVDLIKNMPFTWDETIVLPQSKIGELVVMAKRSGDTWYLGVINGSENTPKQITVDLSFLNDTSTYRSTLVRDNTNHIFQFLLETGGFVQQGDVLTIDLNEGGGFLGRFANQDSNNPPTADAGTDIQISDVDGSGSRSVALDGSVSNDPNGTIVGYVWTENGQQLASGIKPTVNLTLGTHTITLTVTDDQGATDSDEIEVTVFHNDLPVADAGLDQLIQDIDRDGVESVTLDGSGSSDPDGTLVSYVWTENNQEIANGINPTVDLALGTHRITLTVTDNYNEAVSDEIEITIFKNDPPVANAGEDLLVRDVDGDSNAQVTLDGSGSVDPDNNMVSYVWTENGEEIANGINPTVNLALGTHRITLTVSDSLGETDSDEVEVTVYYSDEPTADAGVDLLIRDVDGDGNEQVTLDGSASINPSNSITSYVWTENGEEIANGINPTVNLALGTHRITLTVVTNQGKTDSDEIEVTVYFNNPPVADAGGDQQIILSDSDINFTLLPIHNIEAFHQGDRPVPEGGSIFWTYNGSGMNKPDANDPSTWTINNIHWANDWQGRAQPDATNTTWVVIDLGAPQANLQSMYLWNVQENAGSASNSQVNRGMKDFDIYFATANAEMDQLNPAVPVTDSNPETPYDFGANPSSWTFLKSSTLNVGTGIGDSGTAFDVSGAAGARYIGIKINSNHGGGRVGFAEVAFTETYAIKTVALDGSGSYDPDGTVDSYSWTENGEEIASGINPLVNLPMGTHTITLTVTDDQGGTSSDEVKISVTTNSLPIADAGEDQEIILSGSELAAISNIEAFHQGDNPVPGTGSISRTYDGSGMNKPDSSDPSTWTINNIHWANDWQGRAQPDSTNTTWVVMDLGAPQAGLQSMYLWNVQENAGSSSASQITRGMKDFDIYFATANVEMDQLDPVVPATDSNPETPYDFGANPSSWTFLDSFALNIGTGIGDAGTAFDVSGAAGARYIGIKINSNHGGAGRVGFAEAAFTKYGVASVSLNGSESYDLSGNIASYVWTENGEQIATGIAPVVDLTPGIHTITLTVTDDQGSTDSDAVVISVH